MKKFPTSAESYEAIEANWKALIERLLRSFKDQPNMFKSDFIIAGIVDRIVAISRGFCQAHSDRNYVVAAALLRTQIDTTMRANGLHLVPDFGEACDQIFKGIRFDKLKDANGKQLKDWYLRQRLGEQHSWIPQVYERASGFVHFSNKNVFAVLDEVDESGSTMLNIGHGGANLSEQLFEEMAAAFHHVSKIAIDLVDSMLAVRPKDEII